MDAPSDLEQIVRTFIEKMHLALTAAISEDDDTVRVDLTGPDAYLLLERQGSVLDALQLLMGKVAESRLGLDKRFVVDCEGYRRKIEDDLVQSAMRAAEQVRKLGQPVELEPMNPYERRLIHVALQKVPGVSTESQGDGFIKKIIVSPA